MPQLMKDDSIELDLDDRRRVPVAKVFGKDVKRLRATPLPNGSVVLTPVRSYTDDEIAMLLNPERMESIRRGVEQSKAGEVTRYPAGHFRQAYIDTYGVAPEDDDTVTITISRMAAAHLRDGDPWEIPDSVRDACRAALEGER